MATKRKASEATTTKKRPSSASAGAASASAREASARSRGGTGGRGGRLFLLGHSAGSAPEQPHMQRFKGMLEGLGEVVMVRFKKPYYRMEWLAKQFLEQLQQAHAEQYDEVFLAGVSMGSRVALILRNNHRTELPPNVRGTIAFSYPLFGAAKGDTRESPLIDMLAGDRVLLCNGDRDDMVNFHVLQGILDRTPATSTVLRLEECDHSLHLKKKKQRKTKAQRTAGEETKVEEDDGSAFSSQEDVDAAILQAIRNFVEARPAGAGRGKATSTSASTNTSSRRKKKV